MTVFPIIIFLSLNMGNSGGAMLSRVILNPNYENILIGDSVTLTCIVDPDDGNPTYQWYKDQQQIPEQYQQSLEIWDSKEGDSGDYQCQSGSQDLSDPVTLTVTSDISETVILQGPPPPIYKGDPVTLRCHHRKDYDGRNARFYKDGAEIPSSNSELQIPAADTDTRGTYTCRKEVMIPTATDYTDYLSEAFSISVIEGAMPPRVTLTPNYENIIIGDSVTLTCIVDPDDRNPTYLWYKDQQQIPGQYQRSLEILNSEERDRGAYQCRSGSQDLSDSVTLTVTYKTVILQSPPPPIYEGDSLTLRCRHRKDYEGRNARFRKNDMEIPSSGSELQIPAADTNTTGKYTCRKEARKPPATDYTGYPTEAVHISVIELFPKPIIRVTPERIIEGEEMTVTCDTILDPLRPDTQLQIAFYRDGLTVQEFTLGDIYNVVSARTEDSGGYSCEVRTVSRSVWKRSDVSHIQIQPENNPDPTHQPGRDSITATTIKRSGLTTKRAAVTTTTPTGRESGPAASLKDKLELIAAISVAIIGILVIIIVSAILIWRRKTRRKPVPEAQQPEKTEAEVNDPESQDVCYTYLDVGQLKKGSRKKQNDEPEVTYATVKKSEDN